MQISTAIIFFISVLLLPFKGYTAALNLYTTSWSMYDNVKENRYEYDGAYEAYRPWGKLRKVSNPDMIAQFNKTDVVVFSFLQVWNIKDPAIKQYNISPDWYGILHFDDINSSLPPESVDFLKFCRGGPGRCAAVHNINGVKKVLNYSDKIGSGQLNSFGAFINSDKIHAKRIVSVGGANTIENRGACTSTYDAIFANKEKFLNDFKEWMVHFPNLKGVDYDFEPPIDLKTGSQLPVGQKTTADYSNLFELVKSTRQTLGPNVYISVTITSNSDFLQAINQSVAGGWFKKIAPYVDSVNLMTFDLHGAWDKGGDPYTTVHSYVKHPETQRGKDFSVQYATYKTADLVLSFGLPPEKLQLGIAAYGRGYSGVPAGENKLLPGFEQSWENISSFPDKYAKEAGILPYKSIGKVINDLGYVEYPIDAIDDNGLSFTSGAYIYHPGAQQFVGYQSPAAIEALCQFIQKRHLKGVIMWNAEMDLPVSNPNSLINAYRRNCQ